MAYLANQCVSPAVCARPRIIGLFSNETAVYIMRGSCVIIPYIIAYDIVNVGTVGHQFCIDPGLGKAIARGLNAALHSHATYRNISRPLTVLNRHCRWQSALEIATKFQFFNGQKYRCRCVSVGTRVQIWNYDRRRASKSFSPLNIYATSLYSNDAVL